MSLIKWMRWGASAMPSVNLIDHAVDPAGIGMLESN